MPSSLTTTRNSYHPIPLCHRLDPQHDSQGPISLTNLLNKGAPGANVDWWLQKVKAFFLAKADVSKGSSRRNICIILLIIFYLLPASLAAPSALHAFVVLSFRRRAGHCQRGCRCLSGRSLCTSLNNRSKHMLSHRVLCFLHFLCRCLGTDVCTFPCCLRNNTKGAGSAVATRSTPVHIFMSHTGRSTHLSKAIEGEVAKVVPEASFWDMADIPAGAGSAGDAKVPSKPLPHSMHTLPVCGCVVRVNAH